MSEIINAAPLVDDLGTRDLSMKEVPLGPEQQPQHLPKFYIYAEKGSLGPTYVDLGSSSLTQLYGDDTFDLNKKYFTHQTLFLMEAAAAANSCVVHRLSPDDAKDKANVALYLDVLATDVPLYEKNTDGSLKRDKSNLPIIQKDATGANMAVAGHKVMWIAKSVESTIGTYERGQLTQVNGIQTDGDKQSKQYPILEFAASSPGEGGMKLGVKFWPALKTDATPFPSNYLVDGKIYPYYFSLSKIVDTNTSKANVVLNSFGATSSKFSIKPRAIDPGSGANVSFSKVIRDQYIALPTAQQSGLGEAFVYEGNLLTVSKMLYDAEKILDDTYRDGEVNNREENYYALNIASFTSSNGSPYQSVKVVDETGSVRLTKNTTVYLKGSSDGTISLKDLDSAVIADMDNYNNSLHEYNDIVMHPESIIYDSGFSLATKKAMIKFIARRKDTFVVSSTFAHNAAAATLADQYSVGVALKTMFELYPESATFGTGVMRGVIMGGSGELITSLYTDRVPITFELLAKAARYMGAGNGRWKDGFLFDKAPGSVLTKLKNFDVTWVPASTRNTLWSAGINFVLNYSQRQQFFPALQTVYEHDGSVLNSFFTAVAISYLNKINHAAWREFSGAMSLTAAQLEERVNNYVSNRTNGIFNDLFMIVPNCQVTKMDQLRGYSWTLDTKIYSNKSRTVMTSSISALDMADFK